MSDPLDWGKSGFGDWNVGWSPTRKRMPQNGNDRIAFSVFLGHRMVGSLDRELSPYASMIKLAPYWLWLGGEVGKANLQVVKTALKPELDITPRLVRAPLTQTSDFGRAVFANSITLTPGTVSIELEEKEILIHALDASFADHDGFVDMGNRAAAASDLRGGAS